MTRFHGISTAVAAQTDDDFTRNLGGGVHACISFSVSSFTPSVEFSAGVAVTAGGDKKLISLSGECLVRVTSVVNLL